MRNSITNMEAYRTFVSIGSYHHTKAQRALIIPSKVRFASEYECVTKKTPL